MNSIQKNSPLFKKYELILLFPIFVFAFIFVLKCGERGFYAAEQSIVFDGGYRIFSGQIPYKDFLIPVGPVTFLLQALFFKLLGISFYAYTFHAAVINLLATACGVIVLRLLFPSRKFLSYIAGVLTAVWFYSPYATPYMEQTAFFFSLLSVTMILSAIRMEGRYLLLCNLSLLISGCCAFLAILSKQNIGILITPLYFLLLSAFNPGRRGGKFYNPGIFFTGFSVSLGIFVIWLLWKSDITVFKWCFIDMPVEVGKERFLNFPLRFISVLLHRAPLPNWPILSQSFWLAILVPLLYLLRMKRPLVDIKRELLACLICLYFFFFQAAIIITTANIPENAQPFTGIICAIGLGLLFFLWDLLADSIRQQSRIISFILRLFLLLVFINMYLGIIFIAVGGIIISFQRDVGVVRQFQQEDGVVFSRFPKYLDVDGLESLRWAVPTRIRGVEVKEEDISDLYSYLKSTNKPFFVYPYFTIFYGLLHVPSPQPILWFHKGLTYPSIYSQRLDKWVLDDLKRHKVKIIILEEKMPLDDFPVLKSYVNREFSKIRQISIFNIYEKR